MYYQTSIFYIQYKTNTKINTKRMKKITRSSNTFLFATQWTIPYAPYWRLRMLAERLIKRKTNPTERFTKI